MNNYPKEHNDTVSIGKPWGKGRLTHDFSGPLASRNPNTGNNSYVRARKHGPSGSDITRKSLLFALIVLLGNLEVRQFRSFGSKSQITAAKRNLCLHCFGISTLVET
jgi:hypothetical protein